MKLPLRARITAWYFAVLIVSFAVFVGISDYGFRHSIEITVNDASRGNLESIQNVLLRAAPGGSDAIRTELQELAGLWSGGAVLEVADGQGGIIFQSPGFLQPDRALPPVTGKDITFATRNLVFTQYRIAMREVAIGGQMFRIRAAVPTEPFDQALDRFRLILKNTLPALIVLASLSGYWLSGRSLSPINEIIRSARGIGVRNLSQRLRVPPANDELRRLTETLNDMLGRIESSVQRITQFTADASHDLRTPVALMRASAELALRRSRSEEEYRQTLSRILATSEETSSLIENLLTLARADAGAGDLRFARVDLTLGLQRAAAEADILAAAKGITFDRDFPSGPVWIFADERAVERLVKILLENAVKYTPAEGRIALRCSNGHGIAHVEIRDSGIGVAEKDLTHIFERFYRADAARSRDSGGSGLGLAIASWIVEKHDGKIAVESVLGQGSTFRVSLPLVSLEAYPMHFHQIRQSVHLESE